MVFHSFQNIKTDYESFDIVLKAANDRKMSFYHSSRLQKIQETGPLSWQHHKCIVQQA